MSFGLQDLTNILQIVLISVIVICVLGGAFIYYKMNNKNNQKQDTNKVKKVDPNVAKDAIKNFLPYDSFEDNMIKMDKGDKYAMLIAANGVNYYLMSDVEKEAIEGGFIQILNSLRFPIQIYVQTTSVNLDKSLEMYKDRQKAMEENLVSRAQNLQYLIREGMTPIEELEEKKFEIQKFKNVYDYTQDLINNTENMTLNQWIIKKNYYIVIPYFVTESGLLNNFTVDEMQGIAKQELETRASSIIDGLSNIGVEAHIVDGNELKQVMYAALNRDDSNIFTFERAKESEFDSLFKTTKKAYESQPVDTSRLSQDLFDFKF